MLDIPSHDLRDLDEDLDLRRDLDFLDLERCDRALRLRGFFSPANPTSEPALLGLFRCGSVPPLAAVSWSSDTSFCDLTVTKVSLHIHNIS
jgi:hypothetical protein